MRIWRVIIIAIIALCIVGCGSKNIESNSTSVEGILANKVEYNVRIDKGKKLIISGVVKGNVHVCEGAKLIVSGVVLGNLNSKGMVIISGTIYGNVKNDGSLILEGVVNGNLRSNKKYIKRKNAKVNGNEKIML